MVTAHAVAGASNRTNAGSPSHTSPIVPQTTPVTGSNVSARPTTYGPIKAHPRAIVTIGLIGAILTPSNRSARTQPSIPAIGIPANPYWNPVASVLAVAATMPTTSATDALPARRRKPSVAGRPKGSAEAISVGTFGVQLLP